MKHIRNILLLITIIFAFVMQAEVYQNMLWNFNGAYYLSSRYTTTNDDMDSFLANAEDIAEKHGVHIFSTFNQRVSNYQTRDVYKRQTWRNGGIFKDCWIRYAVPAWAGSALMTRQRLKSSRGSWTGWDAPSS